MMTTITVYNLKGGVGKTTIAFNFAAKLASAGLKVLVLDVDFQANLTSFFDKEILKAKRKKPNIREIISTKTDIKKGIYHSRFEGLDFVKGCNELIVPDDLHVLNTLLDSVRGIYDVCLIDCHPDFTMISENALASAEVVLVPINLDTFSRDNLNLVIREINHIEDETGKELKYRLVVNKLKNQVSQMQIYMDLINNHDYPVLNTAIKSGADVEKASIMHKPVFKYRSKACVSLDINDLMIEFFKSVED